jgi:phage/plasmid-like protein (TIGR03299 family)
MSAAIDIDRNGKPQCFKAGAPAWHNLGVNVAEAQTWMQASALAGMDWTISKYQLRHPVDGTDIPHFALCRDDDNRFLSVVGKGYTPIQNSQCFEMVDALLETGAAHYESAGVLDGGKIVWCLAQLNKSFSVVKTEEYKNYLLFAEFRDGRAATVKVVNCCVVCNNTLSIALQEDGAMFRLRHTKNVDEKFKVAKSLITGVSAKINTLEDKLKALAKTKVTKEKFTAVLEKLFPSLNESTQQQNQAAIIATNFMSNGDHAAITRGTGYGLLQACTQYIDHQKTGLRGEDQDLRRCEYALFEKDGVDWKTDALDTICKVMGVASGDNKIDNILSMVK